MPGVYEIADAERRTIYVGQSAKDVPNRIRRHLVAGGCVAQHGAFWRMQASRVPQADEADLIATFVAKHGDVPACNEATPRVRDARRRWSERSRS